MTTLVPKKILLEQEPFFRKCFSIFYKGNHYQCPICEKKWCRFVKNKRHESLCPNCGSLNRDRKLWTILKTEFIKPNSTLLDFSPSRCLARKLKSIPNINYFSTDLSGNFIADFQYDITQLEIEEATLDIVCCYHILEHIDDDIKAMKELFRVLKPKGKALIQTPFKEGKTYENSGIRSAKDRLFHFGQEDHVRIYSETDLKTRLENVGFLVEIRQFIENENNFFGYSTNESVLIVTKP